MKIGFTAVLHTARAPRRPRRSPDWPSPVLVRENWSRRFRLWESIDGLLMLAGMLLAIRFMYQRMNQWQVAWLWHISYETSCRLLGFGRDAGFSSHIVMWNWTKSLCFSLCEKGPRGGPNRGLSLRCGCIYTCSDGDKWCRILEPQRDKKTVRRHNELCLCAVLPDLLTGANEVTVSGGICCS